MTKELLFGPNARDAMTSTHHELSFGRSFLSRFGTELIVLALVLRKRIGASDPLQGKAMELALEPLHGFCCLDSDMKVAWTLTDLNKSDHSVVRQSPVKEHFWVGRPIDQQVEQFTRPA